MHLTKAVKNISAFNRSVTLIGGGASGLGWATAERVAKRGGQAVILDLPNQDPTSKIQELGSKSQNITFIPADITSVEDVGNAIQQVVEQHKRIDLAVQTAGIGVAFNAISPKMTPEQRVAQFSKCLEVNTVGTFNFVTQVAQQMSSQSIFSESKPEEDFEEDITLDGGSKGCIILTASIAAMDGQRGQAAYSASKGAIVGMTLPLARDLAKHKIRVNTIAPGLFDTPLLAALPEKARISLAAGVPHPSKLGNPAEYAHMVESLFHNPMMNAEVIRLDGALRMNM